MTKLDQLVLQIRNELGTSFLSTDVIGVDGLSIAGVAADVNRDRGDASARGAMIIKLGTNISKKLSLGEVEDTLITTDRLYVILRVLGDGSYTWGLVISREAILGSVRLLMNEYAPQLWDAIPR
jgi:predicted regulator of Ras-like GTPase activity (Roadblock/LC7/MglB family)